ncbi:MAG TPA: hypothetical protein VF990_16320 [Candidatus Dormibacteraeota bacterium]
MPTIRFQVATDLPPDRVLGGLIDFSDQRPIVWPNIDNAHFRVHAQGSDWADVTEGNALAWERNRYEWNAASGEVSVRALESDAWAPGSRWQYKLLPTPAGGTRIEVTAVRTPRTIRGRLIAMALPIVGRRVLKSDMEKVLARIR